MFRTMRIEAALLLIAGLTAALAQSLSGGLVGVIRDATGAGVLDVAIA